MNTVTYSNIDTKDLKNLLTEEEFEFIEKINSRLENTNKLINNEKLNVTFANAFLKNIDNVSSDFQEKISFSAESKKILKLINQNIQFLESIQNLFSLFNQYMVGFNREFEENENNQELQNLKKKINHLSLIYKNYTSIVSSNDIEISKFLEQDIVKKNSSINPNNDDFAKKIASLNIKKEEKLEDNHTLLVSEKENMVFLPYTKKEIEEYLKQYPEQYKSYHDVIEQEFVNSFDFYQKHTVIARFREIYSLIRDKESKSIIEAFKYSFDLMFNYRLHPAIVAACKTQEQLENYLDCLERNKLDEFTDFEIKYEITPFAKKIIKNPIG